MGRSSAQSPQSRALQPKDAFVLHQYEWSETSLILDLFTREHGRVAVVAKGARRPYSQLRAVLIPFQRIHVTMGRLAKVGLSGDTDTSVPEVQTLRSAEWVGGSAMLTGSAIFSGFYLNELLMKLLARQDPHEMLFDEYAATLPGLADAEDALVQGRLRAFELKLLQALGVLPDLSLETLTLEPVCTEGWYTLEPEAGVMASAITGPNGYAVRGDALLGLAAALQHGSLPALQQACSTVLPELKSGLRALLHYHLGSPTMRTRQLMLDVQALERALPTS